MTSFFLTAIGGNKTNARLKTDYPKKSESWKPKTSGCAALWRNTPILNIIFSIVDGKVLEVFDNGYGVDDQEFGTWARDALKAGA